jgi:hypothetical protein
MNGRQPFEKRRHTYSIKPGRSEGDHRIYEVEVTGDGERNFSVSISATQNARQSVKANIEKWCEMNFKKLKNAEIIAVNLDEVQRK